MSRAPASERAAAVDTDATAEPAEDRSIRSSVIRTEPITPLGVIGLIVLIAGFGWFFGPIGLIASIPIALAWSVTSAPFAVAIAVITLGALPAAPTPTVFAVVLVGTVAVLLGEVPNTVRARPVALVLTTVTATLVLASIGYGAYTVLGSWIAPLAVAGVFSLASYSLYRYTIVRTRQFQNQ